MPSKIKPIPLRMPDALKERVATHTKENGGSRHAAILSLIERGLLTTGSALSGDTPAPPKTKGVSPKRQAKAEPVPVDDEAPKPSPFGYKASTASVPLKEGARFVFVHGEPRWK